MLALSLIGATMAAAGGVTQAIQQKRTARQNYQNQQEQLKTQYQAGQDEIGMFSDQAMSGEAQRNVAYASSGLDQGGTLDLMAGASKSAIEQDVSRMKEQNTMNYTQGMSQALADRKAGVAAGTGTLLSTGGSLLTSASSIYSQGVNQGRWTPGRNSSGQWKLNQKATSSNITPWKVPVYGNR